ncbi:fungal-specific transcription factor domain-containing protein [Lasiosphaeria miniovina]|uniref:Fungal-specific transcription factor domain-containing protein n=1 Tax=Lasiosphaeria miniovina TaxID=1954250 RepID=A0AA40AME0_9PEZI|nr:fungal-specific transcription factor domain-containing protein [Lasiosphaeria miniovina]KAK0718392.1 fungal-specific transcription factor domain-containing protein [Lasiosphaeria miniovina]
MSTSPEDALASASGLGLDATAVAAIDAGAGAGAGAGSEPLACVACRARKLKCDRQKPVCARCSRTDIECVYPESRRKPASKRRNVRELEERLAQVEGLLKTVGKKQTKTPESDLVSPDDESPDSFERKSSDADFDETLAGDSQPPSAAAPRPPRHANSHQSTELLELGQSETLPPHDMIEDLHNSFFKTAYPWVPIIHQANYLRAFYSRVPQLRPPMCLQYALWALGANRHAKYNRYRDIFYQRARQYLQTDELKGDGECFITVGHAQAWAIVAAFESRRMNYTRAAMSSARCVRLVEMMGFHRLDDSGYEESPMTPMLVPPKDWIDLEERRRIFWATYCMDCHASNSAGWPCLVDESQITTNMPATEEAFANGKEEKMPKLGDLSAGGQYSEFGAAVVVCHINVQLLKHIHRPRPLDEPKDMEHDQFWKRHRELDNVLSSVFMFVPERFRLPRAIRNPVAVQTNINLHAAVIILHMAACDRIDRFNLVTTLKQVSKARALMAAQEIVNIMKLTAHMTNPKTHLVAMSLYCAAVMYIYDSKEDPSRYEHDNLEFLVRAIDAISRQAGFPMAQNYLHQIILDLQLNGLAVPHGMVMPPGNDPSCARGIPILVRSSVSLTPVQPPLPGLLPLGKPVGRVPYNLETRWDREVTLLIGDEARFGDYGPQTNKRKRVSPSPAPETIADVAMNPDAQASTYFTPRFSHRPFAVTGSPATNAIWSTGIITPLPRQVKLAHHSGSPSMASARISQVEQIMATSAEQVDIHDMGLFGSGDGDGINNNNDDNNNHNHNHNSNNLNNNDINNNNGINLACVDESYLFGAVNNWGTSILADPMYYSQAVDALLDPNDFEAPTDGTPWTLLDCGVLDGSTPASGPASAKTRTGSWDNASGEGGTG